jgi:uncharacterized protein YkwD
MQIGTRLVASIAVAILVLGSAYAETVAERAEKDLFASVNQARRAQGLPALRWDDSLATAARRHAALMAQHGTASHGFEGEPSLPMRVKQAGGHFTWVSENVTQGPNTEYIHSQFLESPKHRGNILDTDMNSVGIGVVDHDGQLFAVEDFAQEK